MRIFVLSDLHGRVPKLEKFHRENYDQVIIAGDLTNGVGIANRLRRFMEKLKPLAPFFYLPGNDVFAI